MNRLIYLILIIFVSISLSTAQEMDADQMAAYMALAQPGPEHQMLENMTGTWKQTIKLWMNPGSEPMETEGQSVNTMVLGGRFLQSQVKGGEGEMAVESLNMMGYDRRNKVFTTVGFDTWGTYYITAAGSYNEGSKSIVMYGEDVDGAMKITQKYNIIVRYIDDDTYITDVVFIDFPNVAEKEFKMVEVVNKRVNN